MEQWVARPVLTVNSTAFLFRTGSTPGMPIQTGQVRVFASSPKAVSHPQNIFVLVWSCAWTSSQMTVSYFMLISLRNHVATKTRRHQESFSTILCSCLRSLVAGFRFEIFALLLGHSDACS